jgi:hypothetical protein
MATRHKTSFAVSVTSKKSLDNTDGLYQAQTVINEHVRKSVGGSGEITGPEDNVTISGGWADGTNTPVTSNGSLLTVTTTTDMLWIKHTGLLFGTTTACADGDTVNIKIDASATGDVSGSDSVILANLVKGEGMLFPRPGSSWGLILASVASHVGVEILEIGT